MFFFLQNFSRESQSWFITCMICKYSLHFEFILQRVELTSEAVEFLNGIFRLLDTDRVCNSVLNIVSQTHNRFFVLLKSSPPFLGSIPYLMCISNHCFGILMFSRTEPYALQSLISYFLLPQIGWLYYYFTILCFCVCASLCIIYGVHIASVWSSQWTYCLTKDQVF